MTDVEKTAEWIKSERQSLIKLSNEINALVFNYRLNRTDDAQLHIEYNVGICVELRIVNQAFDCIDRKEIWNIDSVFESHLSMHSTAKRIKENVKIAKKDLKEMKTMAEKWIKANSKQ